MQPQELLWINLEPCRQVLFTGRITRDPATRPHLFSFPCLPTNCASQSALFIIMGLRHAVKISAPAWLRAVLSRQFRLDITLFILPHTIRRFQEVLSCVSYLGSRGPAKGEESLGILNQSFDIGSGKAFGCGNYASKIAFRKLRRNPVQVVLENSLPRVWTWQFHF